MYLLDVVAVKCAIPLVVISLMGVFVMLFFIPDNISCFSSPKFASLYIGSFIAVANALLLYVTLNSQRKGIDDEKQAHLQERFETTFFNLLDFHRKLTDDICFISRYLDENFEIKQQKIHGRHFFSFALHELSKITKSLESNIDKKYDENDTLDALEYLERKWDSTIGNICDRQERREWVELFDKTQMEYYNLIYSISKDDKQRYLNDKTVPYELFRKRWYVFFEHYVRNLYYILNFVKEEKHFDDDTKLKYIYFVQSQMSRDEMKMIEIHSNSFPLFQEILDKTHLMFFL